MRTLDARIGRNRFVLAPTREVRGIDCRVVVVDRRPTKSEIALLLGKPLHPLFRNSAIVNPSVMGQTGRWATARQVPRFHLSQRLRSRA